MSVHECPLGDLMGTSTEFNPLIGERDINLYLGYKIFGLTTRDGWLNNNLKKITKIALTALFYTLADEVKEKLKRPISQGSEFFTSLLRLSLAENDLYSIIELLLKIIGSTARKFPIDQLKNYFQFIGLGPLLTALVQRSWQELPPDTDTRREIWEWSHIERSYLCALRHLATVRGLIYRDQDSIEELCFKLNIPYICSWGNFALLPLPHIDQTYGRFPEFCNSEENNCQLILGSISEDLETLTIEVESLVHAFIQALLFNGFRIAMPFKKKEMDYRACFNLLARLIRQRMCPDLDALSSYMRTLLNHYPINDSWGRHMAKLLCSAATSHCKADPSLAAVLMLFLFEHFLYLAPEDKRKEITPEKLHSIWRELALLLPIDQNIIAMMRIRYVETELIAAVLFFAGGLMESISAKTRLKSNQYYTAELTRQGENEPMIEYKIPTKGGEEYSLFLKFSPSDASLAFDTYFLQNPCYNRCSHVANLLLELFWNVAAPRELDVECFPDIEPYKQFLRQDEEIVLPRVDKFFNSSDPDPLQILAGISLLQIYLALGSIAAEERFSYYISNLIGHSDQKIDRLGKLLAEKINPSLSEDDSDPIDIRECIFETEPRPKAKLSLETILQEHSQDAAYCYPFLRQAVNDLDFVQKHKDLVLDALLIWVKSALETEKFLPSTIASLCCHSTVEKPLLQRADARMVLLDLVKSLALEYNPRSIEMAVKLICKIHIDPFHEGSNRQFSQLIALLETYSRSEKDIIALSHVSAIHELRVLSKKTNTPPHHLIHQLIQDFSSLDEKQIEKLKQIAKKFVKSRLGTLHDTAQWLVSQIAYNALEAKVWLEAVEYWLNWLEETKVTQWIALQRTLYDIYLALPEGEGSQKITLFFLKRKIENNELICWEHLKKFADSLNEESQPLWMSSALSLLQDLFNNAHLENVVEMIVHPLMKPEVIKRGWGVRTYSKIDLLLTRLYKKEEDQGAHSIYDLLQAYPEFETSQNWLGLWRKLTKSQDSDLIKKCFNKWSSTPLPNEGMILTIAYVLVSLYHVEESFDKFVIYPNTILECLKNENILEKERPKICEKYFLQIINHTLNQELFEEYLDFYATINSQLESFIPFYVHCLQYPNSSFYVKALEGIKEFLNEKQHSKNHRRYFSTFVELWRSWPDPLQEAHYCITKALIELFPQERRFLEKAFSFILRRPFDCYEKDYIRSLFVKIVHKLATEHKGQLPLLLTPNKAQRIVDHLWHSIEHASVDEVNILCECLNIFIPVMQPEDRVIQKFWALIIKKELTIAHNQTVKKEMNITALTSLEVKWNRFSALKKEKSEIIDLAGKLLIDFIIHFNDSKAFIEWTKKIFKSLLVSEESYMDLLLTFLEDIANLKIYDHKTQLAVFLEFGELLFILLSIDRKTLELTEKQILQLSVIFPGYFFFHIDNLGTEEYKPLDKTMEDVYQKLKKSNFLNSIPDLKNELALHFLCIEKDYYDSLDNAAQRKAFFGLTTCIANNHPTLFHKVKIIYHNSTQTNKTFPRNPEEMIKCLTHLLNLFQKVAQSTSLDFLHIAYMRDLFFNPETKYVMGSTCGDERRLKCLKLHVKFIQVASKAVVSEISKDRFLQLPRLSTEKKIFQQYIMAILKNFFQSKNSKPDLKYYHHLLISIFNLWFYNSPETEDQLHDLWKEFQYFITGQGGKTAEVLCAITISERGTLYLKLLEYFFHRFRNAKIVIEDLAQTLKQLPLLESWEAEVLTDPLAKAILQFSSSEQFVILLIKPYIDKYFIASTKANQTNQSNFQKVRLFYSLLFSAIDYSTTLDKKTLREQCVDEIFQKCTIYVNLNCHKEALDLFACALTESISLWKPNSNQQSFYLTLCKVGFQKEITCSSSNFKTAVTKGILDGENFNELKKDVLEVALQYINQSECEGTLKGDSLLESYFYRKCSLNYFQDIFWLKPIFKKFTNSFVIHWKQGANIALDSGNYYSCLQFCMDSISDLYPIGVRALENLPYINSNIHWDFLEQVVENFSNILTGENLTKLMHLVFRCLASFKDFKINTSLIVKLKAPLIQHIQNAAYEEALYIHKEISLLIKAEKSSEFSGTLAEIILHLMDILSKAEHQAEAKKWYLYLKKLSYTSNPEILSWKQLANQVLDQLFVRNQFVLAIKVQSLLVELQIYSTEEPFHKDHAIYDYFNSVKPVPISALVTYVEKLSFGTPISHLNFYYSLLHTIYEDNCNWKKAFKLMMACFNSKNSLFKLKAYSAFNYPIKFAENEDFKKIEDNLTILIHFIHTTPDGLQIVEWMRGLLTKFINRLSYIPYFKQKTNAFIRDTHLKFLKESTYTPEPFTAFMEAVNTIKRSVDKSFSFSAEIMEILAEMYLKITSDPLSEEKLLEYITNTIGCVSGFSDSIPKQTKKSEKLLPTEINLCEIAKIVFPSHPQTALACLFFHNVAKHVATIKDKLGVISSVIISIVRYLIQRYPSPYLANVYLTVLDSKHILSFGIFKRHFDIFDKNSVISNSSIWKKYPEQEFLYQCWTALFLARLTNEIFKQFDSLLSKNKQWELCEFLISHFLKQGRLVTLSAGLDLLCVVQGQFSKSKELEAWYFKYLESVEELLQEHLPVDGIFYTIFKAAHFCDTQKSIIKFIKPCFIFIKTLQFNDPFTVKFPPYCLNKLDFCKNMIEDCFLAIGGLKSDGFFKEGSTNYSSILEALTPWLTYRLLLENKENKLIFIKEALNKLMIEGTQHAGVLRQWAVSMRKKYTVLKAVCDYIETTLKNLKNP